MRVPTGGLTLEPELRYGEEYDRLFQAVAPDFCAVNLCVRDAAYLRWRYLQAPRQVSGSPDAQRGFGLCRDGALVGFVACALRQGEDPSESSDHAPTLVVVDLFCPPKERLPQIALQLLVQHAAALGCGGLELSGVLPRALQHRLLRCGFLPRERASFLAAGGADAASRRGWLFTDGDQDFD